ncbi:MAG TPA: hypothetical protein VKE51_15245 [Vicinamibacterales bacterium]|nr:hypothetical protein [Vicinamibacterales bacterium]
MRAGARRIVAQRLQFAGVRELARPSKDAHVIDAEFDDARLNCATAPLI